MNELITEAFRLINFPFTLLVILVILYWSLVAFGALAGPSAEADLDLDAGAHFDADAGADLDAQLDHDVELDTMHHHVEGHHSAHAHGESGSWWNGALKFVNLGEVPAMVVLSVLILSLWTFGIIANAFWTGGSALLAAAFLALNFVISAFVTRYVTLPLKPLFRLLNKEYDEAVQIVGRPCRIVTSEATGDFGQAEVTTSGAPILINVRTLNDAVLARGDLAVVVREDVDRRIFYITANPLPRVAEDAVLPSLTAAAVAQAAPTRPEVPSPATGEAES
jgi:hypothetical protein